MLSTHPAVGEREGELFNWLGTHCSITALCTVYCNHAESCTVQYITEARWLVTRLIPLIRVSLVTCAVCAR